MKRFTNNRIATIALGLILTGSLFYNPWIAKTEAAMARVNYEQLRQQNQGQKAEELKLILTTEKALSYTFAGFGKPEATKAVLDRLHKLNIRATFFVGGKDIKNNPELVERIVKDGHELGVAVYAYKSGDFATSCRQIEQAREELWKRYKVKTNLVKQPWGVIEDYTKEAVAAEGMTLIGHNINIVQSRHKEATNANDVLPQLFGKYVYSMGRGWIANFRMDYYDNVNLCADILQLLKESKVDNIAYWSFTDDPENNPQNDSAYVIKPVGEILNNKDYRYSLPATDIPDYLKPENINVKNYCYNVQDYIEKRYLGAYDVNIDSNALGMRLEQARALDLSGLVHVEKEPVVFFGFDDWGTDAAINPLLYVLRKHKAPSTFFILTRNVKNNPNLLRAIAEDGNDIACHTDSHKPLAVWHEHSVLTPGLPAEERYDDLRLAYGKLAEITGDVKVNGRYSLTRMFRPPTLTVSKLGFEALYELGYDFVVSGSTSTHDYAADDLYTMIDNVRKGLYKNGKVMKGAVFVAHMSDTSKYTARALDIILTENEKRRDGDPKKFKVGLLSNYLTNEYDQSRRNFSRNIIAKAKK